jgi:hypothetical protein
MRILLFAFVTVTILFYGCFKSSDEEKDEVNYGNKANTWTFTEGSKVFSGRLLLD